MTTITGVLADPAARPLGRDRIFRTWTPVVAVGEVAGFLAPAAAGVTASSLPSAVGVPLVLLAGAVEGAVLGFAQQSVLRRVLPDVRGGRWVALTAVAAVAAYLLGFTMSAVGASDSPFGIAGAVALGALLLVTIGGAQLIELRRHVPRAARWVGWTGLAWLGALTAFLTIATPLWHPGQATAAAIAIGILAESVMALVQAAITGWGLQRMMTSPTAVLEG